MTEVWEQTVSALRGLYEAAAEAIAGVSLDPASWGPEVYLVAGGFLLVIVLLLALRRRRRMRGHGPQFLLTNGQVALVADAERAAPADGGPRQPAFLTAPEDADYQLRVTFNNLNPYPVQLLEVAVRTGTGRIPVVAEASAVVPPNGAVDVVADLHDLPGERGVLQAYVFATRSRPQNLRLSVPLEWEPWNLRYRVKATQQRVESSQGVASEQVSRMERAAAVRTARKERLGAAVKGLSERVSDAAASVTDRARAAAAARQARARAAAAERTQRRAEAAEPTGPISVPLPPSRRPRDEASEPRRVRQDALGTAGSGQGDALVGETLPVSIDNDAQSYADTGADPGAEADAVGAPRDDEPAEEQPRRRLEFPDEF